MTCVVPDDMSPSKDRPLSDGVNTVSLEDLERIREQIVHWYDQLPRALWGVVQEARIISSQQLSPDQVRVLITIRSEGEGEKYESPTAFNYWPATGRTDIPRVGRKKGTMLPLKLALDATVLNLLIAHGMVERVGSRRSLETHIRCPDQWCPAGHKRFVGHPIKGLASPHHRS